MTRKRILYLTSFYEPDLSAGAFRNTTLSRELARQCEDWADVFVFTTMPMRIDTPKTDSQEQHGNLSVFRLQTPETNRGMGGEVKAYSVYFRSALKLASRYKFDLVFASTSKLLTGYLGAKIAKKQRCPLYLDVRDLFYENLDNILTGIKKKAILQFIKKIEKRTFKQASHINLITEGFKPNFEPYKQASYSFYTNGIDDLFLRNEAPLDGEDKAVKTIVYAGNIGYGQGLSKIIPQAARALGGAYKFIVIGSGGKKPLLEEKIKELQVDNVVLREPVSRKELIKIYEQCDYTFVHLNDYEAFKKVLPSKIFELACFPQPMIAGVGGFANRFVADHIENKILFAPCDTEALVRQIREQPYIRKQRSSFIQQFRRKTINEEMARSILNYIKE